MINISIYQFSFSIALNFNLLPYLLCKCRIVVVNKTDFIVLIIKVMIVMYNSKKGIPPWFPEKKQQCNGCWRRFKRWVIKVFQKQQCLLSIQPAIFAQFTGRCYYKIAAHKNRNCTFLFVVATLCGITYMVCNCKICPLKYWED